MVTYTTGNIFESSAQVITNMINCEGVMGKGLALQFKKKFPQMFHEYKIRCDRKEVQLGCPYLWEDERVQILNFPTKDRWREKPNLIDIEKGLKFLAENYTSLGICSLALPPLGCGLGGLEWNEVQPIIEKHLGPIVDLEVYIYVSEGIGTKPDYNERERSHTYYDRSQAAQSNV